MYFCQYYGVMLEILDELLTVRLPFLVMTYLAIRFQPTLEAFMGIGVNCGLRISMCDKTQE